MNSTNSPLTIMQFNVERSKSKVLTPLLARREARKWDVILVQEPWRNPFGSGTYCPRSAGFTQIIAKDTPEAPARACIFINNKFGPDQWSLIHRDRDLVAVRLAIATETLPKSIMIVSIYNPSPRSTTDPDPANSTIPQLDTLLRQENTLTAKFIAGDFNLHHPHWEPHRPRAEAAATTAVNILQRANLRLITPPGLITRRGHGYESTIDLAWCDPETEQAILQHTPREDLQFGSDHIPILTKIDNVPALRKPRTRNAWAKANEILFRTVIKDELGEEDRSQNLVRQGADGIDGLAEHIVKTIQLATTQAVPTKEMKPKYAVPGWNGECDRAVTKAKRMRRAWQRTRTETARKDYQQASNAKKKIIDRTLRERFRQVVRESTDDSKLGWQLARWAQADRSQPAELPHIPDIADPITGEIQTNSEGKARALTKGFFPSHLQDHTLHQFHSCYPQPVSSDLIWTTVSKEDVVTAIAWTKKDKAPGPDKIQLKAILLAKEELLPHLQILFNACVTQGHHPGCFREALIVPLRKPKKTDYTTARAWRPIALLNTVGKLLEAIVARKIRGLAEEYNLLPETQMGARQGRDAPMAVELLTDQIHTAWKVRPSSVASVLSLDMAGAFNCVPHIPLTHQLRSAGIPPPLVKWVTSFSGDRRARMLVQDGDYECEIPGCGLPQGSPVSPILFILYIADLVRICNDNSPRATCVAFVDDLTLLAVGADTAETTAILSRINLECISWAQEWGWPSHPKNTNYCTSPPAPLHTT